MANLQVTLRRMQQNGSFQNSPGPFVEFNVPKDDQSTNTYIVKSQSGDIRFVSDHGKENVEHACSVLESRNGQVLLQSLVEQCRIEMPNSQEAMPLPRTTPTKQHYLHLRPGDVIHFPEQALFLTIDVHKQNPVSVEHSIDASAHDTIQVRSSLASQSKGQAPPLYNPTSADEETDDDLDASTPLDLAQATPRAIKDEQIADHVDGDASVNEEQLLSTAPDTSFDTPASRSANGDSTRIHKRSKRTATYSRRHNRTETTPNMESVGIAETPVKHDRRSTQSSASLQLPFGDVDLPNRKRDPTPDDSTTIDVKQITNPSSTPINEHDAAEKAATRSVQSSKRKFPSPPDEDFVVSGKRKKSTLPAELDSSPSASTSNEPTQENHQTRKVLLTSSRFGHDKKMHDWLRSKDASTVDDIPGKNANFLCVVGEGGLATTAKLLRSLALGKTVVTDKWLAESRTAGRLLPLDDFSHPELFQTDSTHCSKVFAGKSIFVTASLHSLYGQGWQDVENLVLEAGAESVDYGGPRKWRAKDGEANVLFIGAGNDDKDARQIVAELSCPVFSKNLLTRSVLRGELLLDDGDLQLHPITSASAAKKSKRRS